ncbi:autotransporter domain-containing protein [Psychrobacter sp. 16-Bac2893]
MPRNTSHAIVNPTTLKILTKSMLAISLSMAGLAHAELYSSVTFFGDSLTDGGYFSPITQGKLGIKESGQFTTNPDNVWATSFAEQLGTTSVANTVGSAQTGNNYAIGSARADEDVTLFGLPVASVKNQVNGYLANNKVDPNGMYVVWAGANDLRAATQYLKDNIPDLIVDKNGTITKAIVENIIPAANSQVATIDKLHKSGAKYILVPNIPDIGLTPEAISGGAMFQSIGTGFAAQYNQLLLNGAAATGANIIPLDTFSLLQQVAANPNAYGFTNITQKACNTSSSLLCGSSNLVVPGANESYFFADGIHPSGRAHQMIADYASAVVTAPSLIGVLPHIATTAGQATSERLQSHINQIQSSKQKPSRKLWATGEFENQDIAGFEGDSNTQVLLGVDFAHPNSAHAVTGLYGNITQKDFENSGVRTGLSNIDLEEVGFGVYHSNTLDKLGGLQLNGAVGFGNLDVDVTRAVTLGGNKQEFNSNADGKRYYANLQAGYPMQLSSLAITPYIGATASRVRLDALKEQEMSGIAMQFDEQKYTTTYGKLGVKANHNLGDSLNVFGDVHYQKQLSDNREAASARLNTIANISFDTPMVQTDDDNFGMTLGVSKSFGQLNANAGVTHSQGDDDKSTSLFVGLSSTY